MLICNECAGVSPGDCSEELAEEALGRLVWGTKTNRTPPHLESLRIGQDRAKRAFAVAVYNHYKRINFHGTREVSWRCGF